MVALAAFICGLAAYVRNGAPLTLVFTFFEVSMLLARCATILGYKRRARDGLLVDSEPWLVGFGFAAILSSLLWGALCFGCLAFSHDPVLYAVPVLATVGTAGAVAARNSGVPRLAKIQLMCSLTPIVVGSIFADDAGYALLAILTPAMAIGLFILIAERNDQLVALIVSQSELARLSRIDSLTQISNRRHFGECLDKAWRRFELSGCSFSVIMVDVDHFKAFNDRYGHPAGDACLQAISRCLEQGVRDERDLVARYGGEEFALLLDGVDLDEATAIAGRLCSSVRAKASPHAARPDALDIVTISCGVASSGQCPDDGDSVVKAADEALYAAKRLGRNRVEPARPLVETRAAA